MPSFLKVQFARGITQEMAFGVGTIDWCAFAQETNETQRRAVRIQREKLLYAKKFGLPPTKVTWKRLKKEKVDISKTLGLETPGTSKKVSAAFDHFLLVSIAVLLCSLFRVNLQFPSSDGFLLWVFEQDVSEVCASRIPNRQEVDTVLRIAERVERIESLIKLLGAEIIVSRNGRQAASFARDNARKEVEGYEKSLDLCNDQLAFLKASTNPEAETRLWCAEQMKTNNMCKLSKAQQELSAKEAEFVAVDSRLRLQQKQLAIFTDEASVLKFGGRPSAMHPWPGVYSSKSALVSKEGEAVDHTKYIAITVCSLCEFPFPNYDIIVASCLHLYHPWCAVATFGKGGGCVQYKCFHGCDYAWLQSFGWPIDSAEAQEYQDLEEGRWLQDREDLTLSPGERRKVPNTSM